METDNSKPLLFLEPLSETLKKLKEVVEQNAEAEGIEVFEVESLEEIGQLLPSIGQSLILTSHPKMCAMMLQKNKRAIKNLQSKTILLSPKAIPRKTLDKFMKVGLTECVTEPVNPKTLLYKVKLQLRSIATKKESGEMQQKFEKDNEENVQEENSIKTLEKKVSNSASEPPQAKDKPQGEAQKEETSKMGNKSNFKEESIDGFYKNKNKKQEVELDLEKEKEKNSYQEEAIDGFYKGKTKKNEEEAEEIEKKEKKKEIENEEIENFKEKINLDIIDDKSIDKKKKEEIEEEQETKKKKKSALNIVEDDSKDPYERGEKEADLGGHYKGKTAKGLNIEEDNYFDEDEGTESYEDEKELKSNSKLDITDDSDDEYLEKEEEYEEEREKKKRAKLQIESDDLYDDKKPKQEEDLEEPTEDLYKKDNIDIEDIADKRDRVTLDVEKDNEEDEEDRGKVDELDKYMRGGEAKKEDIPDEEKDLLKKKSNSDEQDESSDLYKKAKLDIDEDSEKSEDEDLYGTDEKDQMKKRASGLNIEEDNEKDLYESDKEDDSSKDPYDHNKNKLDVEDDSEYGKRDGSYQEKEQKYGNRSNARADKIETHYSSKNSVKHNNNDWGDNWKKPEAQEEEFPEEREELALIIPQAEDLGEQTIDYAQLKKEFEGINYDLPRSKRNSAPIITSLQPVLKTFKRTVVNDQGEEEIIEEEELIEEEVSGKDRVFEPNPVGMDIAILILNLYYDKEKDEKDIFSFCAQEVFQRYSGYSEFFTFDKDKGSYDLEYTYYENVEDQELRDKWSEISTEKRSSWQNAKLPVWEDQSFQSDHNTFIFPIYEGVNPLGYSVVHFDTQFSEDYAKTIEMILESTRGVFLQIYENKYGVTGSPNKSKDKNKEKEKEKTGGFFGGLFGKKKKAS